MSSAVEKSYLPQYIQFKSPKPEYVRLENEADPSAGREVITFPAVDGKIHSANGGGDGVSVYVNGNHTANQNPKSVYPQLTPGRNGSNYHESNASTPLLIKKKIVPTKTNFFGVLLAFISGVFFTLCSGTVKYLTNVDPMELLILRSTFQVSQNMNHQHQLSIMRLDVSY
jgi:hypothetical protein